MQGNSDDIQGPGRSFRARETTEPLTIQLGRIISGPHVAWQEKSVRKASLVYVSNPIEALRLGREVVRTECAVRLTRGGLRGGVASVKCGKYRRLLLDVLWYTDGLT